MSRLVIVDPVTGVVVSVGQEGQISLAEVARLMRDLREGDRPTADGDEDDKDNHELRLVAEAGEVI